MVKIPAIELYTAKRFIRTFRYQILTYLRIHLLGIGVNTHKIDLLKLFNNERIIKYYTSVLVTVFVLKY